MTSSRPYLIRAMYQWIVDNAMAPHLLIDAGVEECVIPIEHIDEGKIVLNIAPMAISGLVLGDDDITFSARFSGKPQHIYVPVEAVLAIYARENGQGMMFSEDKIEGEGDSMVSVDYDGNPPDPDKPRPTLKIVK
jgi:stringent starvation protein B